MPSLTRDRLRHADERLVALLRRYAHWLHRVSLGLLYVWFGLLKPLGHETTTSLLAETIYWGSPQLMVVILGWWEVAIGLCLAYRRLLRLALILLLIRVPGILVAFVVEPEILFFDFPFAPSPQGQYLIKDLVIFIATLAIAGSLREPSTPEKRH